MKLPHLFTLFLAVFFTTIDRPLRGEPDNIDVVLFKNLPLIVHKLKEREIRNVGVLPFRFKDHLGIDRTTGSLIQSNLAARTERVIAYIRDVDDPVNVVFAMLSQAREQNPAAAYHTTETGRELLKLKYRFPVAEMQPASLDGFITGAIEVSSDWKQSTLRFEVFDAKNGQTEELGSFSFPTDRKMLMQYGRAYSLSAAGWKSSQKGVQTRSIFSLIEHDDESKTVPGPQENKTPIQGNPWETFPVTLVIKYDGKSQSLTSDVFRSTYNFAVADPKPRQRVTFELTNNLTERLAVVLSVNGRNLIYNENANDPDSCNKFVLEPMGSYSVPGLYLPGLKSIQPLFGQDNQATSEIAKQYPADAVGVISLSVYRSVPANDPGGVIHLNSSGPTEAKTDNTANALATDSSATSEANSKPQLEFLPDDDSEFWYNRFQPSLIRSSGKQPLARGSFHAPSSPSPAKTWSELSKGIGRNALMSNSTRGLIAPGGETRQQKLDSTKLGPVSQTDVAVIRYLSVTQ